MSDLTDAEVMASLVLKVGVLSGLGLAAVYGWVVRSRTTTQTDLGQLAARGRVVDLAGRHEYALAALKQLEVERDKMPPEDYARERAALLAQGAAAMRELDGASAPQASAEAADTAPTTPATAPTNGPAELAAALKALKDAGVELSPEQVAALAAKHLGAPGAAPAPGAPKRTAPAAPAPTMAPEVKGALWTLGGAAMIGFLLYAMQGSVHERGDGPMTGGMGMGGGGGAAAAMGGGGMGGGQPQAQAPQLDPMMAADKVRFESAIKTNPDDLEALNGLTEIAFAERDLGVAMQRNGRALEVGPNDLTSRTYQAVLRSAVGLNDGALQLLDSVLAEDPSFTKALVYKGLVAMDLGKYSDAADALAKAVELEGPNDFLQSRLEEARSMAADPNAAPPRRGPAPPMGGGPAAGGGGGEPVATGTVVYPDGFQAPPGAILYVSLRSPAGGPPLAAKKFPAGSGSFSFELTTGDAISMGGAPRPFPDTMALSARVDLDGNAMTKEPDMPQATLQVQKGATGLTLTLTP